MKKALILFAATVMLAIFASSCKSSQKCPAYGEHQKYQIEQRY